MSLGSNFPAYVFSLVSVGLKNTFAPKCGLDKMFASAPETTLIDCVGFVAACAESTVLVSSGALRSPGLLNALAALSRTATADELSRFADAVGSRVYLLGKPWGQAEDDLDKLPAEDLERDSVNATDSAVQSNMKKYLVLVLMVTVHCTIRNFFVLDMGNLLKYLVLVLMVTVHCTIRNFFVLDMGNLLKYLVLGLMVTVHCTIRNFSVLDMGNLLKN
ncbi:hypothetical protein AK812_SmicGene43506 [Symbiodinium microadriaticum]|uniref:Uncharacterized protein n=1 Tax=Symbiodinium microadriaticum TaxID=2951 RepID=A0A1Q9C0V1_SYMMI|nr:hypothetical protein AK812_SmicGene43506 [Symbiodinium microadriaticum]